jgi:hypothetical protein
MFVAAVCGAALASGGSSIAFATTPDDTSSATTGSGAAAPTVLAVTLTDTALEGLPAEIPAGVVDVTVTDETETSGAGIELMRVEPGTDHETFTTELVDVVFTGGPFPDYILNGSSVVEHGLIALDAGEYIVWYDRAFALDRETTADDLVTASLTVVAGDDDAVIPEQEGGSIRAGDYLFDVDVTGAGSTVLFTNSSDNQFHHVVLFDFGSNDPALVEANLLTMLETEGAEMPGGVDPSQINFEFAESGVFGPGSSGTFEVTFESGHTYAAVCFISDREGGLPHVFQHAMADVFQMP